MSSPDFNILNRRKALKDRRLSFYTCLVPLLLLTASCSPDPVIPYDESMPAGTSFLGEVSWANNYGGSGTDTFHSVIATTDGGFAALGSSNSTDGDLEGKALAVSDYWLAKIGADGELQWSRTFGGSMEDLGQALIQTADGGFALTGNAMSSDGDASNNEGFHDNWILKLDAAGNLEWEESFGFSGHDHSYDLLQTEDGGYFFVGFLDVTAANGAGNDGKYRSLTRHGVGEFWGTKIDAGGNLEWRRYFGGTNNDRAHAVVEAHTGGFVLAGFSESEDFDISNSKGSYDFWVVRISNEGDLLWEKSYGGSGIEVSYDIAATADGAYVVVGNTFSTDGDIGRNNGESDIWMIKINEAGDLLWERNFGGSGFDSAQGVSLCADGGFVIAGNSKSTDGDLTANQGENDIWLLKTDADGIIQWQGSVGGPGLDFGFKAVETEGRDLLVAGESSSAEIGGKTSRGGTDAVIIRIASGIRYRTENQAGNPTPVND